MPSECESHKHKIEFILFKSVILEFLFRDDLYSFQAVDYFIDLHVSLEALLFDIRFDISFHYVIDPIFYPHLGEVVVVREGLALFYMVVVVYANCRHSNIQLDIHIKKTYFLCLIPNLALKWSC